MAAELIEKPLTEAQRIIDRLEAEFAMTPAEIARQTKMKAQTIHDIKRRTNTGNLQLRFLRPLIRALESTGNPLENAGRAEPPFSNPEPSNPEPLAALFDLNAAEPEPEQRKSFGQRAMDGLRAAMLGDAASPLISQPSMTAPSRKGKGEGKGDSERVEPGDIADQLAPTAAFLLILSAEVVIPDPYKPCAPTDLEARALTYPVIKRLARMVEARRKFSEADMEVLAILLATTAYGKRAHDTYKVIRAQEVERARSNARNDASGAAYVAASGGGSPAASPADAGAGRGVSDANAPLPFWRDKRAAGQAARPAGREPSREPVTAEQRRADASIDALLAADHAGRLRLGL